MAKKNSKIYYDLNKKNLKLSKQFVAFEQKHGIDL